MASASARVEQFMQRIINKNPGEGEFGQAVRELTESLMPFVEENPQYRDAILFVPTPTYR